MKLKTILFAVVIAAMLPVNAFAAVKISFEEVSKVYGKDMPFDTYIQLESTGYGLVNNNATLKIKLENGKFAKDDNGEYYPVYVTDLKEKKDRNSIETMLDNKSVYGFGVLPSSDTIARLKLPEDMIDGHAQIMFTATAEEYGNVSVNIENNRDICFIVKSPDDEESETADNQVKIDKVTIPVGANTIYVGDSKIELDTAAYISGDTVKLPLRAVSEIFGAEVQWNGAEKSITIECGDDTLFLKAGDRKMLVNGYAVPLSSAPEITNGRIFVPLRDMAQMFGIREIGWDDETKTVSFDLMYTGSTYTTYNKY